MRDEDEDEQKNPKSKAKTGGYSTIAVSPRAVSSAADTISGGIMVMRSFLETMPSPCLPITALKRRMEARMRALSTALRTVLALEK
eukprot:FN602778.1.p1 GENE.FN602778.1~~FN602778.1.p1  ORF type:complete len:86 (-),score=17.24 FN602778.1:2-259(-)